VAILDGSLHGTGEVWDGGVGELPGIRACDLAAMGSDDPVWIGDQPDTDNSLETQSNDPRAAAPPVDGFPGKEMTNASTGPGRAVLRNRGPCQRRAVQKASQI
jgi:hypothetical protein